MSTTHRPATTTSTDGNLKTAARQDDMRDLARTSDVVFEDRGERELKGIAEPQRLFAVRERD